MAYDTNLTKAKARQELLGRHVGTLDAEYLTADELEELGLEAVSESGTPYTTDEMRADGVIFRLSGEHPDEVEGYMVESMDAMSAGAILHRLTP